MSASEDRDQAKRFADDDILGVLYRQHADIADALDEISASKGDERRASFQAATAFMKKHETAEQSIVRPIVEESGDEAEARSRMAEEQEADRLILQLSSLDLDSPEFETRFASLKSAVTAHADAEENNEFPILEKARNEDQRIELGRAFLQAVAE